MAAAFRSCGRAFLARRLPAHPDNAILPIERELHMANVSLRGVDNHPARTVGWYPWRPGPDRDKDAALASRRRIFDMAATDRLLVLGFHHPFQVWDNAKD